MIHSSWYREHQPKPLYSRHGQVIAVPALSGCFSIGIKNSVGVVSVAAEKMH